MTKLDALNPKTRGASRDAALDAAFVTGEPRPEYQVLSAIRCIEQEMVLNPLAMSTRSGPLLVHYAVIRDALRELLALRDALRRRADDLPSDAEPLL